MIFATGHKPNGDSRGSPAFTLFELILVMALLMIVIGVAMPSLKNFFRGRYLDDEARRFLSLTRYGQSESISDGVPVELWINVKNGSYGLRVQSGYTESQSHERTFTVDKTVQVLLTASPSTLTQSNYWTQTTPGSLPTIRFQPDGFIGDMSPQNLIFRQEPADQIRVTENSNHMRYEIR
jgi:Tfp pilus assembly protein FimT